MIVILYSCIPQVVSCRWEKYRSSVDPFAFAMTQCIPNSIIEHLISSINPRRDVYLLPQATDHLKLYLGSMPKQSAISWAPVTPFGNSLPPDPLPSWSVLQYYFCLASWQWLFRVPKVPRHQKVVENNQSSSSTFKFNPHAHRVV